MKSSASLPHARGGVSKIAVDDFCQWKSSPRPWGCFLVYDGAIKERFVFPTPVGVFPQKQTPPPCKRRLPHARGGVSKIQVPQFAAPTVFPTPVGVFLGSIKKPPPAASLPHARGGVSDPDDASIEVTVSSPRPWGCFSSARLARQTEQVFPTPVGVFPRCMRCPATSGCLPHARGGVSSTRPFPA